MILYGAMHLSTRLQSLYIISVEEVKDIICIIYLNLVFDFYYKFKVLI